MCYLHFFLVLLLEFTVVGILGTSDVASNVWSAVSAVVVLHIALALYIRRAYYEADKIKPEEKVD